MRFQGIIRCFLTATRSVKRHVGHRRMISMVLSTNACHRISKNYSHVKS